MPDDMNRIVVCRHCGRKELYGRMMWLNGRCECRACYKSHYEEVNHELYRWNDLDWTDEELALLKESEKTK